MVWPSEASVPGPSGIRDICFPGLSTDGEGGCSAAPYPAPQDGRGEQTGSPDLVGPGVKDEHDCLEVT